MAKKQVKPRICLGCWDEALAVDHAAALKRDGFDVSVVGSGMSGWITYFRNLEPDAVVIDLDRLPSHGREVGMILQASKSTRHLPLVYLGGLPEKVDRLRQEVPDALYAKWENAATTIEEAIALPVTARSVERPAPAQRDGQVDLARRLGIKADLQVVAWGDAAFLLGLLAPCRMEFPLAAANHFVQRNPVRRRGSGSASHARWAMLKPPLMCLPLISMKRFPHGLCTQSRRAATPQTSTRMTFATLASRAAGSTSKSARSTRTGAA